MIELSVIDDFFQRAGTAIGITFIRANQDGPKPDYPYGIYNLINEQLRSRWEYETTRKVNEIDDSLIDITVTKRSEANISITILDKEESDTVQSAIRDLIDFINIDDNELAIDFISPAVEDRTVFFDNKRYEYRKGFDIRMKYADEKTTQTERVETLEVTPTVNGVERDEITITSN